MIVAFKINVALKWLGNSWECLLFEANILSFSENNILHICVKKWGSNNFPCDFQHFWLSRWQEGQWRLIWMKWPIHLKFSWIATFPAAYKQNLTLVPKLPSHSQSRHLRLIILQKYKIFTIIFLCCHCFRVWFL